MKKGKLLLSILAAAVFATAAGALVACSDVELPQDGKKPVDPKPIVGTDKSYTVTFDADGGTLDGSETLKTDATTGLVQGTVPTATKAANKFNGWTLTKGETTTINFNTQTFKSDKTVYASYTPNGTPNPVGEDEYTITFSGGLYGQISGENVLTTDKDGKVTFPTIIPDKGYALDYWELDDGTRIEIDEEYTFTRNSDVTAKYKEVEDDGPDDTGRVAATDDNKYYLVGGNTVANFDWNKGYEMTANPENENEYEVTVELPAGYVFKIRHDGDGLNEFEQWDPTDDAGWNVAQSELVKANFEYEPEGEGSDGKILVKADGKYRIIVKADSGKMWVVVVSGGHQGGGGDEDNDDPDVNANTYYLIGTITDWAVKTDAKYVFTKTKDADDGKDQYLLSVELKANDKVKIVKGKKTQWIGSWEGGWDYAEADSEGNLVIGSNASYDIYLKVDKDDAEITSVYVAKQGGSGEANNDDGGSNFYLFGTMNGQDKWGVNKGGIKFVETDLNINEDSPTVIAHKYKVEVDLVARDKVKIFRTGVENSWDYSYFEAGSLGTNVVVSDTDLTIMTAGHYTFYLREYKDTTVGSNGYTVRVFFVAPAPADNATAKINDINIPATAVDTSAAGHATLVKWYKSTGVQIADNTKIKFYVDGKVISVLMRAAKGTIIDGAENMAEEFTVTKGDKFEIHIKYYSDDGWKVWMKGEHDYSQSNPTPTPGVDANAYYLVGTMTGWDINPATTYKLTPKENENDSRTQYMLTIKLNKDDLVKIVKGDGSEWIDAWQQNWAYGVKDDDDNLVIQQNGTYEFYLKLAKDDMPTEIWVSQQSASGGNGGGGQGDSNMVATNSGNQDDNHPNVYLIKNGDKTKGYLVQYEKDENGYIQYKITIALNAGDKVAIYVPAWEDFVCTTLENEGIDDTAQVVGDNINIKVDGTYTFYFKNEWHNDRIYLAW